MFAQILRDHRLASAPLRDFQNQICEFIFIRRDLQSVQFQKHERTGCAGPLVPVDERVILNNVE